MGFDKINYNQQILIQSVLSIDVGMNEWCGNVKYVVSQLKIFLGAYQNISFAQPVDLISYVYTIYFASGLARTDLWSDCFLCNYNFLILYCSHVGIQISNVGKSCYLYKFSMALLFLFWLCLDRTLVL